MHRCTRVPFAIAVLAVLLTGFSMCGGSGKDSPSKNMAPPHPETCGNFESLAPNFDAALKGNQLTGLRQLITQLSATPAEGGAPPMSQALQALFVALHEFAQDPPEVGNTDGLCNEDEPPPLNQTNRLCDLRRLLKIYIHDGQASRSLHALDPVVGNVLGYITGQPPASDIPHYEVARDLELMCQNTGQCNPHDTFDLVEGITGYLTPARGSQMLGHVEALIDDPLLTGSGGLLSALANDGGANPGAEAGFALITDELLCAVAAVDPDASPDAGGPFASIDGLLTGTLFPLIDRQYPPQDIDLPDGGVFHSDLHGEIAAAAADAKDMLDPTAPEPVLQPLQKTLQCATVPGQSLCGRVLRPGFVPMVYHLGFEAKVVGLSDVLGAVNELVSIDAQSEEPGMVMKILHDIAAALNRDDEALGALTGLCHTAFQTQRPCDDGQGSDCPALPLNAFGPNDPTYSPLQEGCVNGAGAAYAVPSAACLCNAEAVTPEVAQLFKQGMADEIFCVLDTLVYGCAGGSQPACAGPTTNP